MSSCSHFQCLDLSKNWSLEWGQLPGLPQSVDPAYAAERLDTANLRFAGFAEFSEASFSVALLGVHWVAFEETGLGEAEQTAAVAAVAAVAVAVALALNSVPAACSAEGQACFGNPKLKASAGLFALS